MYFHLPKPLHGWRAFIGEVAVIVLGVMIALSAQQTLDSIEWRRKVGAAVADMNQELSSGNGPQAYSRLALRDCLATHLDRLRTSVEKGDRAESRKLIDQFWLPNRTWDSLAREAATAADVTSHMPHERMLQYRIAYVMIPDMQRLAETELSDLGHLRALPATGGLLTTDEKLSELGAIEALKIDNDTFGRESRFLLVRLRMMDLRLGKRFVERDVRAAQAHYGTCITSPQLPPTTSGPTISE